MHELADEVIWIHRGRVKMRDNPDTAIAAYEEFLGVSGTDEVVLEDP
jgi:ABC-type polysaccharide/polyol phosphate transport system ATPase subunit